MHTITPTIANPEISNALGQITIAKGRVGSMQDGIMSLKLQKAVVEKELGERKEDLARLEKLDSEVNAAKGELEKCRSEEGALRETSEQLRVEISQLVER